MLNFKYCLLITFLVFLFSDYAFCADYDESLIFINKFLKKGNLIKIYSGKRIKFIVILNVYPKCFGNYCFLNINGKFYKFIGIYVYEPKTKKYMNSELILSGYCGRFPETLDKWGN